jgi:hypothetical protein
MGCPHCGLVHNVTCPRIKAIDYYPDGIVKRIELNPLESIISTPEVLLTRGIPNARRIEKPTAPDAGHRTRDEAAQQERTVDSSGA